MEEKERVIKDRLQRLLEGIKKADYKDCDKEHMVRLAEERINELQKRGVYCVDRFVKILTDRVNDKEAYLDILMEGRFAIILARNKFSEIHIEYCERGPDIKANYNGLTIYFEITRIHPERDEWAEQHETAFVAAFVSPDRIENILDKIQGKLKQLQNGEINVVVIWSDTINLLPYDLEEAFKYIKQEIDDSPEKYKNLSGVLFTEGGGVDTATLKQFYLVKNDKASKPLEPSLAEKLELLLEQDIKKLRREMDKLNMAFRQLRERENQ